MKKTELLLLVLIAVMVTFLVGAADKADAATGSVMISAAEFTPDGFIDMVPTVTGPGSYRKSFDNGGLSGTAAGPCLVAPVKIPGTATKINNVIVYLIDEGNPGTIPAHFKLISIELALNASGALGEDYVDTDVGQANIFLHGIQLPLLKKKLVKGRLYQVGICLDDGQHLYAVKVVYTVP